jgi:hypothetical protein
MKVPRYCGAEIRRVSQRTHYYKSARLEKLASPVKKNEKPLLELLHPRMEIPTYFNGASLDFPVSIGEDHFPSTLQEPCLADHVLEFWGDVRMSRTAWFNTRLAKVN